MFDRHKLELTLLEIARQSGEGLDSHTRYTIHNGLAQALQAKVRHRRRMNVPAYQWKKPTTPRR
ncbi:hypothetical protein LQF95_08840 [Klebsiella quasipneumoniae]|uniref:hypothetical protein n=1 Tax=Klebsiella pneumoniae complex TaxID=3390273 RepID=UPI000665F750|nr:MULTISPECIES: hypothetical protein [Klebsiella]HEF8933188.1 hypothetical protein [Klebsiella pneumoniae]MCJ7350854.1 hypothetical protein [Klebsiella quasipneumoniae]VGQ15025.1 hypothetical protein SB6094_05162 [Klebsiella quasivariicola]HCM5961731.1 hypothetical protein [Klebsiella quasipneumoniae]HEF8949263.1 hypothetical protein [Klebsiella pneumoniae]